jgi:DNA-binding XRE family transcriptional regulator
MPYGKRLQKFWDNLPEDEKEEIKQESEALKVEYSSLQAIRKRLGLSQQDLANSMGIKQVSISKLENRDDMKISTLKEYFQGLGATNMTINIKVQDKEFQLDLFNYEKYLNVSE